MPIFAATVVARRSSGSTSYSCKVYAMPRPSRMRAALVLRGALVFMRSAVLSAPLCIMSTTSAIGSASSRWCVVSTIVRPALRSSASSASMRSALARSMLEKGSSSSSSSGCDSSTRASEVRCRMPCEYCPTGRASAGSSPTMRSASSG